MLAAGVLVPLDVLGQSNWWVGALTWLGEPIAEGAVAAAALALLAGNRFEPAFVGVAVRRAPAILVASIARGIGILVGLVLLVFPGLVVFARWSVFVPVLINERAVGLGLERSWGLVKGRSWVAFWLTFLPTLAAASIGVGRVFIDGAQWVTVDVVAHVLLATYSTVVAVVLYRWLVGAAATKAEGLPAPDSTVALPQG